MQRQKKKFFSRSPAPSLLCLIDELALRRDAGPGIMAGQVRHLADAAAWPAVTVQLIPAMLHPGLPGSIMLADGAALLETHAGGQVFEDADTRHSGRPSRPGDWRGSPMNWRKSTYSQDTGGACVEVATAGTVLIRDTASRDGLTLSVSASAWSKFTSTLK
jgi:hypothetical protein